MRRAKTHFAGPPAAGEIALAAVWIGTWVWFFVSWSLTSIHMEGLEPRLVDPWLLRVSGSSISALVAVVAVTMLVVPRLRDSLMSTGVAGAFLAVVLGFAIVNSGGRLAAVDAKLQCALHGYNPAMETKPSGSGFDACLQFAMLVDRPSAHAAPVGSGAMMGCELGIDAECISAAETPGTVFRPAACRRLADLGGASSSCPAVASFNPAPLEADRVPQRLPPR